VIVPRFDTGIAVMLQYCNTPMLLSRIQLTRVDKTATDTDSMSSVLAGSAGLTKNGTGNLTLTSANTYKGTTTINAGTLIVGNGTSGSIGSTSSIVNNEERQRISWKLIPLAL